MKVVVASGKGGTGKTTVSSALFALWDNDRVAVDMDVEEPNMHLFLNPHLTSKETQYIDVPQIDYDKCNSCGLCSRLCNFNSIARLGNKIKIYNDMCHSCGLCINACPNNALNISKKELGEVSWGQTQYGAFIEGKLKIGVPLSPPLMSKLSKKADELFLAKKLDFIIDAPPGTSCPAINAVSRADLIVMVTEPTSFGMNDLSLAIEAFKPVGKKMGIIINKADLATDEFDVFIESLNIPILGKIRFNRQLAECYSCGDLISFIKREMACDISLIINRIKEYA